MAFAQFPRKVSALRSSAGPRGVNRRRSHFSKTPMACTGPHGCPHPYAPARPLVNTGHGMAQGGTPEHYEENRSQQGMDKPHVVHGKCAFGQCAHIMDALLPTHKMPTMWHTHIVVVMCTRKCGRNVHPPLYAHIVRTLHMRPMTLQHHLGDPERHPHCGHIVDTL